MTTITNDARGDQPRSGIAIPSGTLARLRAALEEQRQALLQRAAEFGDDIEDLQRATATHGQGESEHANREVERGMTVALEANALAALEDVALALARLDDGSYGTCTACGAPIGVERLLAVPQASYCVACQQRREGEDQRSAVL